MAERKNGGVLALFDVDSTLTAPRKEVTPEMLDFMKQLRGNVTVGMVGDLIWSRSPSSSANRVLGLCSETAAEFAQIPVIVITDYDYVFSENGLVAHKNGELIGTESLKMYLGDDQLKEFINFTLHYIADLDIPIKRGTFIEFRSGMINVSPIGRNCSQEERDDFQKYDKVHNVRPKMVTVLRGVWWSPPGRQRRLDAARRGVCAVVANEGRRMEEEEGMRRLSRLGDPSSSSFARGHPRTSARLRLVQLLLGAWWNWRPCCSLRLSRCPLLSKPSERTRPPTHDDTLTAAQASLVLPRMPLYTRGCGDQGMVGAVSGKAESGVLPPVAPLEINAMSLQNLAVT